MKIQANKVLILLATLTLGGCGSMNSSGSSKHGAVTVPGKVVGVGKTHFIVDDGDSIAFIDINADQRKQLASLKKGDKVTLVGKKPAKADKDSVMDVEEVVTAKGQHIRLN